MNKVVIVVTTKVFLTHTTAPFFLRLGLRTLGQDSGCVMPFSGERKPKYYCTTYYIIITTIILRIQ